MSEITYPRVRPATGITLPVTYVPSKDHDGDTQEFSSHYWPDMPAVRLRDVWCCESNDKRPPIRELGLAAKGFAEYRLSRCIDQIYLHVPGDEFVDGITHAFSMGRVIGYIFLEGRTLNELLIDNGFGFRTKKEQQAAEAKIMAEHP